MRQIIVKNRLLWALALLMSVTLQTMADSRWGISSGVQWSADFDKTFENNTDHTYEWWTGEGFGAAVDRLCSVEITNSGRCSTANPGFDITLGVGTEHKKDMEYQSSEIEFFLVDPSGSMVKVAKGDITSTEANCYKLENTNTTYGFISHPQLWRTGSGVTNYGHKIGARITLGKNYIQKGFNRLLVKGYSKYYKNPTWRAEVWMKVNFSYYINLNTPNFDVAPEPKYEFTGPTEMTLTFNNGSVPRINSNQFVNTNESTRLGIRHCGIEENSISTSCKIIVDVKENGAWKNFGTKEANIDGFDPQKVKLDVPAGKPIRLSISSTTTSTLKMKSAFYRNSNWTTENATVQQVSKTENIEKTFEYNPLSEIKTSFNQVTGKVLISWDKDISYPINFKCHIYRTLLNDKGAFAGNREELGTTKSNTFEDSEDRGMLWGRKYRYEVVLLADEWLDNGYVIPTDPQPLSGCIFGQSIISTTPSIGFHLTQDMNETEKIKISWNFNNIPQKETDLNFRVHRIEPDGKTTTDYGSVSARRKDGKASFTDDKPAGNCDIYKYFVQLDVIDNSLHYLSDTITARITAHTTLTNLDVTKGSSNEGVRVTWKVNQVGTNPTFYQVKRRFIGSTEWSVLHTTQGVAPEYTFLDTNTETGRYYEYCVEVYGTNCEDTEKPLLTDSRIEPGFGTGTGTISGTVKFGTGTAVGDVKVNLMRSDDEKNGHTFTYARQILEAGNPITWKTSVNKAREIMGASKDWSVQMWVRPDSRPNDDKVYLMDISNVLSIYLDKAGSSASDYQLCWVNYEGDDAHVASYPLDLSQGIPANEYTHITITHKKDTVKAYVNGKLAGVRTIEHQGYDKRFESFAGDFAVTFGHQNFTGCMDEVRLWSVVLTDKDVANNFGRMIGGREDGLKLYWPFDEGINEYAFDLSRTSGVANGNHPDVSATKASAITPASNQLGLYGMTNEKGEYIIRGIPFVGSGTGYTVRPELGVHEFSPATRTGFISTSSLSLNNYDFTDISSFTVKGRVYYEGTDVPVDSVQFAIDGTPCMADGELVYTNADGEYTISVPIGFHYITASRSGHTFVANGRYPQEKGTNFEFRTDQTINFTDNTLVHFGGRLTGGAKEGIQPLGYGVSKNTIGQATIQLEALDFPQCRLNVVERNNGLVTETVNNSEDLPVESESGLVKSLSWRAGGDDNAMKRIYIKTDPKTGEFSAMLPPLRYRVSSLKFEHNPELDNASVFQNLNAIDLTKVYEQEKPDTLWDDSHTSYQPLFRCHKTMKLTYRSPVEIEVYQVGAASKKLFGTDTLTVTTMGEDDVKVAVAEVKDEDNVNYLFGYPIFEQGEQYEFKIKAFEKYLNYDDDKEGRRYDSALSDSIISIDNEMGDQVMVAKENYDNGNVKVKMSDIVQLKANQLRLDSEGSVVYKWRAGFPNLTAPYTRSMNIFTTVDKSVYGWKKDNFEGVVTGAIPTGNNFVTTGPEKVAMVLRDPPGANSSASWQNDTIIVKSHDNLKFGGETGGIAWKFGTGMDNSMYLGMGVMTKATDAKAMYLDIVGTEETMETIFGGGHSYSITTSEKVTTNNTNSYVGSEGDVFIGFSKNYLFGGAMIVGLFKQPDGSYALGMDKGMSVSDKFNTLFRYTQKYIEKTQLPNLRMLRNQLLTYVSDASKIPSKVDRPTYYTTLKPDDAKYGSNNCDKEIWGDQASDVAHIDDGPSYVFRHPENYEGVDSVGFYNNAIDNWIKCLRDNEEDKVKAFNDPSALERNFSWDRGTTETFTSTTSNKTWDYSGYALAVKIYAKLDYGAEGTVSSVKTVTYQCNSIDAHLRNTAKDTDSKEDKQVFSYTLNDNSRSAALSVDVFKSPKGWGPIFRTRGGQTMCPYEGEEKTKYYKPATTLNYATMKIDNPKISIPHRMILDVPSGQEATLEIILTNESETGEALLSPDLKCLNDSSGLQIFLDGEPITRGVTIPIPYGVETKKILTIRQADTSVLDYNDVPLGLISTCKYGEVYDQSTFSIHFTQSAPHATIAVNKTIINATDVKQNSDGYLTVTAKDYDRTFKGFKSLKMKYRFIGDNNWITAQEFFNGMSWVPGGKLQDGQSLLPEDKSSVNYSFSLPTIDGHYMVCVETTSQYEGKDVTWQSEEIEVVKDIHGPMLLGQAYPNTGILTPTDDIHIKFNEHIRSNYLTKAKNFRVIGELSESPIDHYVSLQLNGNPLKMDGYVPLANTSFSTSMWLYRQSGGTIFEHGTTNSKIVFDVDDNGNVTFTVDGQQFAATAHQIPANEWGFLTISYVYGTTETYLDAEVAVGDKILPLFHHQVVPSYSNTGQITVGENLKGAIHELTTWATARTPEQMREYMWKTLPTYKDGLVGYWKMNEGHGTVVTDYARGHNIYLENESWNLNNENMSAHLDGNSYIKADVSTEALSDDDNYVLTMWFKGDKDANANASLLSLTDRMSLDFDENQHLVLRTYRGESSIDSDGLGIELTDVNYNNGLWHHFALNVRRGISANVFIDGQAVKTINEGEVPAFAASHVFLGARERSEDGMLKPGRMFKGDIDEFAVWKITIDGTSISESRYFQYDSLSTALLVYYPMEHKYKDENGVVHTEFSLQSGKKSTTGELRTAEAVNVKKAFNAPPLKVMTTQQNLDFDFTASDDEIFITLKTLPSRMHGNLVSFTIQGVPDIYGNLSEPITWTARANYSTLKWETYGEDRITIVKDYTSVTHSIVSLVNVGATSCNYKLSSLPSWIIADKPEGTIGVGQKEEITFTITENAPFGVHVPVIYASNNDNILEDLVFEVKVYGNEPQWDVRPEMYENSMSIIGQVYVSDKISTQPMTKIYAFVGDECRGVARPELMSSRDAYFTNLVVYGNPDDEGQPVTFRIYDGEKGVVYSDVLISRGGESVKTQFINNLLMGNYDEPIKWNAASLIEQILDLEYSWNWISINVQPLEGKESPGDVFGTSSVFNCVKDKEGGLSFLKRTGWEGTLTSVKPGKMYKLRMTNALKGKTIKGSFIDPKEKAITIYSDYNWIGSLSIFNLSLDEAFSQLQPVKGDWVIGKQGAAYYNGFKWEGTLQSIIPGRGYIYRSKDTKEKTFHFPSVQDNLQANKAMFIGDNDDDENEVENDWTPFVAVDHHKFSDNMHVVATLTDGAFAVDTAWVAAYIDDECRGVTRAINGIYYITVAANAEESGKLVKFRTFYDNEVREIVETSHFVSDIIEGDPENPTSLTIGNALGIKEQFVNDITIAPNKTQRMVFVRSQNKLRSVEIFSTMGALLQSTEVDNDKADLDLLTLPDGLYIVKVVDKNGNECVKRVIKTNKTE